MGLFDDLMPSSEPRQPIPEVGRALLNAIAGSESPDYNVLHGGSRFEGFDDHPRQLVPIMSGPNAGKKSSAAGRYQFLAPTWDEVKQETGLPDFSPESQDIGAWHLATKTYKAKTGRDLERDLTAAKGSPNAVQGIGRMLSGVWTSLPGGIEPNRATSSFASRLDQPTEVNSRARTGGIFDDLLPAAAPVAAVEAPPASLEPSPETGGRFTDNPGKSFRMAREGEPPPEFMDRLAAMWANPPKDKASLIGAARHLYDLVGMYRDAREGKINVVGEDGRTNPEVIGKSFEVAASVPMVAPAGGIFAAPLKSARSAVPAPTTQATVPGTRQAVLESAERIGVDLPRAVASDSMSVQRVGAVAANAPVAGNSLRKASETAIEQLGAAKDKIATRAGGKTAEQAGAIARDSLERYVGPETSGRVSHLYKAVDKLVDPAVKSELGATRGKIAEIVNARTQAGLEGGGKAVDAVLEGAQRAGGLTYEGIKKLRQHVGELLERTPEGMSRTDLKRIYGALSEDLKTAVKSAGGDRALSAFERANTYNRLVQDRRDALAKIIGAGADKSAENVFGRIMTLAGSKSNADAALLLKARRSMPADEWSQVASGAISKLGLDNNKQFSPALFLRDYAALSPAGKSTLFKSTGNKELVPFLDDIAAVSQRFKQLQRFANPSGTGQTTFAGAIVGGGMLDPMSTMSAVLGTAVVAKILSQPALAAPAAQVARAQERLVRAPSPSTLAAFSAAVRNLATNLSDQLGVKASVADFLQTIMPQPAPTLAPIPVPRA